MAPRRPATPFLALDLVVVQENVRRMAERARDLGIAVRPHVKTHKCLELARLQLDAGARGITVATVGEAEVFVDGGVDDVFVAYPLWVDTERGARLRALRDRAHVQVGIDSAEGAAQLRAHAPGTPVVVEVDSGHHRTGVRPAAAGALAAHARGLGLDVRGVFTFPGHSYAPGEGRRTAQAELNALAEATASLRAHGVEPRVVSGGSSPTAGFAEAGLLTELRPGAYVVNDAQQWELGACAAADIGLTVHSTVVSHAGGRAVLDAGSKALAADRAPWATGGGRLLDHPDARVVVLSEHHAVVDLAGDPLPPLGSVVRVVPNHCCNAIALADDLHVVAGGAGGDGTTVVATWAVAARGRNA